MSCTHKCQQGRTCTCYGSHFDHLGQQRGAEQKARREAAFYWFLTIAMFAASAVMVWS